ncbi:MAG: MFS transporter [Chthoniobacterales bacterium]|nr:MFS transporter [Chthoniobacterales bacterium]
MSTIVVTKLNGEVCIGADSLTCFGSLRLSADNNHSASKIIKVGDTFLGLPGTAANSYVFQSYFDDPSRPRDFSSDERIFETLRAAHRVLREDYFMLPHGDKDDSYELTQIYGLGANPHGIFGFFTHRSVIMYKHFWAAGSGRDYALGAMQAGLSKARSARELAKMGLETAAYFDDGSSAPFDIHTIKLKKDKRGSRARR